MPKFLNRNTRTRSEICSKITIKTPERRHEPRCDAFIVNFTYFTCYSSVSIVDFEQVNVCQEPVLWIYIYPRAERRHSTTVFIFQISHLVLIFLLLILSIYLIAGFDISYFRRFQIKMNPSFMAYSFLQKISTKWNAHPLASSSKQAMFITNFNTNCANFFIFFLSLDK